MKGLQWFSLKKYMNKYFIKWEKELTSIGSPGSRWMTMPLGA